MYCGQCGKKVMENMLFCPFCGSPIVIPDQDETRAQVAEVQTVEAQAEKNVEIVEVSGNEPAREEAPTSLFAEADARKAVGESDGEERKIREQSFVPLSFDFDAQLAEHGVSDGDKWPPLQQPEERKEVKPEAAQDRPQPVRRPPQDMRRMENGRRRSANTYIPVKELDVANMFMDGDDEDDYDADDFNERTIARSGRYQDDFEFEEPEHGGFFQRHIRGLVGLLLFAILLLICTVWAFSGKGQRVLAQVNLAWTAQPYADLGYEAYQQDSDLLAARYYEKAYSRESDNYEYAHSAMVAYYEANEIESAAAMLKKCIEMAPNDSEPYREMLILYPDAQTRPWEITELIRLGYQRTGDEALKLD